MNKEKFKLNAIQLKGYKSINEEGQNIPFGDITIFIGANGAGKSNLVSFFSMLDYMMRGALQNYIGENGSADSLLYYGAKRTKGIEAAIQFGNSIMKDHYRFILSHAAGDTMIFTEEVFETGHIEIPFPDSSNTGNYGLKETMLSIIGKSSKDDLRNVRKLLKHRLKKENRIYNLLNNCQVFQFHDTSSSSRIRNKVYINDNRFLRSDGGNLAAFLYMLKETNDKYYQRILRYIRQIMPQFWDFELSPSALNEKYILLNWRERKLDYLFGSHQISDGSLRFICLATLLLQPPEYLPSVIIIDEPELGLHPSAIALIAGMAKTASKHCQIIMATQSPRLVDEFDPENIVVVERDPKLDCSIYKKLDKNKLSDWLKRYSLSELWEKNILGGQP